MHKISVYGLDVVRINEVASVLQLLVSLTPYFLYVFINSLLSNYMLGKEESELNSCYANSLRDILEV